MLAGEVPRGFPALSAGYFVDVGDLEQVAAAVAGQVHPVLLSVFRCLARRAALRGRSPSPLGC